MSLPTTVACVIQRDNRYLMVEEARGGPVTLFNQRRGEEFNGLRHESMAVKGQTSGGLKDVKPKIAGQANAPCGFFCHFAKNGSNRPFAGLNMPRWLVE